MLSFFKKPIKESKIQAIEETKPKASFKDKLVSGATAIEYALIAALIAVAIIGALNTLSGSLETTFNDVSTALDNA